MPPRTDQARTAPMDEPPRQAQHTDQSPAQLAHFDRPSEIPGVLPSAITRQVSRVRTLPEVPRGESFAPQIVYYQSAYWVSYPDGTWGQLSTLH